MGEVELLLEAYHRKLKQSSLQVNRMTNRVRFGWSLPDLKLAAYRARMDLVNVQLGVAALSLGFAAAVAGFFGMNVPVPMAENPAAFGMIIASCSGVGALIVARFWVSISARTTTAEQQRMESAMASKRLLGNIMAVDSA